MSKIVKIGVVANTAFNIVNFRLGLIDTLLQSGYTVIAIAPKDGNEDRIIENKIKYIPITQLSRKGTNPIQDILLLKELYQIYKKEQLDIVLQYTIKPNIYGALAARLANVKSICTVTGLGYTFLNNSIASKVSKLLYRMAFRVANKIVFQNSDDADLFIKQKLVDKNKTMLIAGSGIDTGFFSPTFCENNIKDEAKTSFLMIARLLKDKGIYEYIEAVRNIKLHYQNVEFVLLGGLDEGNPAAVSAAELQSWINQNLIIYYPHTTDVRPFICKADCVVLPSYREGMPRAILEAMAMQKPTIATNVAGCKDVVENNKTGFLCEVADFISLQNAFEKFMRLDINDRIQFGKHGRYKAITQFSADQIYQVYIQLIKKSIN